MQLLSRIVYKKIMNKLTNAKFHFSGALGTESSRFAKRGQNTFIRNTYIDNELLNTFLVNSKML